jgi:hypothetical protein
MATKDKLPSNADIWGGYPKQHVMPGRHSAKPTRKPQTRKGVPFKKQGKRK